MSMCLYVYVPYICIHMNAGTAKSRWGMRADAWASAPWGRGVCSAALDVGLYFHTFVRSLRAPGFHSRLSVWMAVFRPPLTSLPSIPNFGGLLSCYKLFTK
ncbi:unnamed protein product [Pipistrellus nathusii]|uniref:Secreted protein n=1 Tax=Pipistrellus nathusii TaxID=59473 RepID=A0ABP0AG54_PIPNA